MNALGPDKHKVDVKDDEMHLLLDHDYDNIQELNHPLPSWWNAIFVICVIHAVGYFAYYQFLGGPTLMEEFDKDYGRVLAAQKEFKRLNATFDPSYYASVVKADGLNKGKVVYENYCMPCHMESGKGDVGPNLTDKHWILAKGTPETIHQVAYNGSEENGMPPWGDILQKDEIYQAVVYVMSLKNTFVAGKEPQGEVVED